MKLTGVNEPQIHPTQTNKTLICIHGKNDTIPRILLSYSTLGSRKVHSISWNHFPWQFFFSQLYWLIFISFSLEMIKRVEYKQRAAYTIFRWRTFISVNSSNLKAVRRVFPQFPSIVLSFNEKETIRTKALAHFKSQFIKLSKTIKCYTPNLSC